MTNDTPEINSPQFQSVRRYDEMLVPQMAPDLLKQRSNDPAAITGKRLLDESSASTTGALKGEQALGYHEVNPLLETSVAKEPSPSPSPAPADGGGRGRGPRVGANVTRYGLRINTGPSARQLEAQALSKSKWKGRSALAGFGVFLVTTGAAAAVGFTYGATLGSWVPGVGTAIGGVIGLALGIWTGIRVYRMKTGADAAAALSDRLDGDAVAHPDQAAKQFEHARSATRALVEERRLTPRTIDWSRNDDPDGIKRMFGRRSGLKEHVGLSHVPPKIWSRVLGVEGLKVPRDVPEGHRERWLEERELAIRKIAIYGAAMLFRPADPFESRLHQRQDAFLEALQGACESARLSGSTRAALAEAGPPDVAAGRQSGSSDPMAAAVYDAPHVRDGSFFDRGAVHLAAMTEALVGASNAGAGAFDKMLASLLGAADGPANMNLDSSATASETGPPADLSGASGNETGNAT